MLRLQDLTELDIRRYVSDKLEGVSLKASPIPYSSSTIKDTIDKIVEKAENVFLSVNLAVRDQLEGIRNGDDAEQLRERLEIYLQKSKKYTVKCFRELRESTGRN